MNHPVQIRMMWKDGDGVFVPSNAQLAYCRREFGDGEIVTFERNEERSQASHDHFFVWLEEAWLQLPENLVSEYPTVESLRAKALIRTGFCHETDTVCENRREAAAIAGYIKRTKPYTIVEIRDNIIKEYSAKSQSRRSMRKKEFQDSKDKVMSFVSDLIGVTPEQLRENA